MSGSFAGKIDTPKTVYVFCHGPSSSHVFSSATREKDPRNRLCPRTRIFTRDASCDALRSDEVALAKGVNKTPGHLAVCSRDLKAAPISPASGSPALGHQGNETANVTNATSLSACKQLCQHHGDRPAMDRGLSRWIARHPFRAPRSVHAEQCPVTPRAQDWSESP